MKKVTINKKEIDKFSDLAEEWWNPDGKFKPLHKFNPIRVEYIRDALIEKYKIKQDHKPLRKLNILDIGCGGGLISEPMSRMGAKVTGIDASEKNIKIAKLHSKINGLDVQYYCSSPERFKRTKFDVILNLEIIEHVQDVDYFIKKSSSLLKKNGIMFIATLNRTLKSYFQAIIGAEYFLRWLPIGTHDWNKFITPKELIEVCENNSLKLKKISGVKFNLVKDEWALSNNDDVNYITQFIKV